MSKVRAFFDVIRYGSEVADPESWKKGYIDVNKIIVLLSAVAVLLRAFGVSMPIDDAGIAAVAAGLFALANMVVTAATSKRAGLLPAKPVPPDDGPAPEPDRHRVDSGQPTGGGEQYNAERGY